jgi:predicted amidohydrolase
MKIYLSRWVCLDVDANLRRLEAEAVAAAGAGCELVVFPELFLTGYRRRVEPARARDVFARVSAGSPEALLVMGSLSEEGRNRVTVWLAGREVARYDKAHLFHGNREHEMWSPGEHFVALRWRGVTVGLLNCNDVRYPEQARALRLEARCDLLVAPAWWPWRRDHVWRALLEARSIENAVWVAGCAVAASAWPGEDFAGAGNHVFDPSGEPVRTLDDRTYELDVDRPAGVVVDPLRFPPVAGEVVVMDVGGSAPGGCP